MEILILTSGIILGVMFYNLFKIFRTSLSLFSTYFIIDYLYPNKLPTPLDINFKYLFFENPFIREMIFYGIIIWLLFYWVLRLLMQYYFDKVIVKHSKEMSNFDPKKDMPMFFNLIFLIGIFIARLIPKSQKILDYKLNLDRFIESSISFTLIVIHLSLFICLTIKKVEISIVIILIILIITFIGLPYIYMIYDKLEKYTEERLSNK